MAAFEALMALSRSKTQESENLVQLALKQRQLKEDQMKQQREAREKKDKEIEIQQRLKHFEEEKRKAEEEERKVLRAVAREKELRRRQEEQRTALLNGPKNSKSGHDYPSSKSSKARETIITARRPKIEDEEDQCHEDLVLTREEKRARKQKARIAREYELKERRAGSGSGSHFSPNKKTKPVGRRLPGGAIDLQSSATIASVDPHMSVKDRLKAMPNTLTKLNVVKRDMRTIDEIMQDRAKAKESRTLHGEEAKNFNGWFDPKKSIPTTKSKSIPSNPPSVLASSSVNGLTSNISTVSPRGPSTKLGHRPMTSASASPRHDEGIRAPSKSISRLNSSVDGSARSKMKSNADRPNKRTNANTTKRPRSPSLSDSSSSSSSTARAPAHKRISVESSIRDQIWSMFGKDRSRYVVRDVLSDEDDEDMEADATALEREEIRSGREARKEDERALREQMERDEQKRARRRERGKLESYR